MSGGVYTWRMIYPDPEAYAALAKEHDVVPVFKEILADTETPVSVLQRFSDRENAFLLESMEGGETWGRFSFIGVDPEPFLAADHTGGATGGLESLRQVYQGTTVAEIEGLPRFFGGVVGFVGYEGMCEFERMPLPREDATICPCSRFVKVDKLIIFDNVRHTVKVVVCTRPEDRSVSASDAAYQSAVEAVEEIVAVVEGHVGRLQATSYPAVTFDSNMTRDDYRGMVNRAKEYIYAGDIIQVVLSQRFSADSEVPPLQLYRALRLLNPSPYTFFLKMGAQVLVGSSPEVMVRLTGRTVELRPIAGTRPRGATDVADAALEEELLADEKEKAEHVMLVDLGRNDIGRVATSGSVDVSEYMVIERYSHVMHMVSHVMGELREGLDAYDVMKATFPAGTLTGAPKIRAMEIIHELEPGPRGAYGGGVGYISYTGNMDLAITIRTLEVGGGRISVQAGAGIVFDSDPDREFDETCHKARGMQKAVELAVNGLEL